MESVSGCGSRKGFIRRWPRNSPQKLRFRWWLIVLFLWTLYAVGNRQFVVLGKTKTCIKEIGMTDNQTDHTAAEGAAILLRDYRERRKAFHALDDYDKAMSDMRRTASAKIDKLGEPLKTVAARLFSVTDRGFLLFQVCGWKLDYLAEALIHAMDVKNPLALANNARALMEHLAVLVAIVEELEELEVSLRGQGQGEAINDALGKTEKFIHRGFYGKSPKLTDDKNEQALHIDVCLRVLKKEVADIEDVYNFLCDCVHPSHGSSLLVSHGQTGGGRLNPPEEFHRETLDSLERYCSLCMVFLRERGIQRGSVFIRLQGLLELCFDRGANVANVFIEKSVNHEGDGKSRDTAFFFPEARTATEALKLSYELLEKEGYSVQKKDNGGFSGNFIYDIYVTDKGTVWFKIPMM
jgi:hypothetical protein